MPEQELSLLLYFISDVIHFRGTQRDLVPAYYLFLKPYITFQYYEGQSLMSLVLWNGSIFTFYHFHFNTDLLGCMVLM